MVEDGPTTREQIFAFIVNYKREHDGLSPTTREIADACFLHESTARYHLMQLALKGRIRLVERRGIEVIGGAWEPPDSAASGDEARSGEVPSDPDADPDAPPP